jgi:hypothetical protein
MFFVRSELAITRSIELNRLCALDALTVEAEVGTSGSTAGPLRLLRSLATSQQHHAEYVDFEINTDLLFL